jgi:hypothetical protein
MANPEISIEDRVVLFMDVHNFSIAFKPLGEDFPSFLQEMYENLGDISTRKPFTSSSKQRCPAWRPLRWTIGRGLISANRRRLT